MSYSNPEMREHEMKLLSKIGEVNFILEQMEYANMLIHLGDYNFLEETLGAAERLRQKIQFVRPPE